MGRHYVVYSETSLHGAIKKTNSDGMHILLTRWTGMTKFVKDASKSEVRLTTSGDKTLLSIANNSW
jgi:hypothetical protein